MTYPNGGASEIWRDTEGGSAHNPSKAEIREWGGEIEAAAGFSDADEFFASTKTYSAGVKVSTIDGACAWGAVASGGHVENAGGQRFEVLPGPDGKADVRSFGVVVGTDSVAIRAANVTAWSAACASDMSLLFPAGDVHIDGTVTGGEGGWFGQGIGEIYGPNSRMDASTNPGPASYIITHGTNSGNPFLNPPNNFEGFQVEGDARTGVGITLGTDSGFVGFKKWKKLSVRNFDVGIDGFNFYACAWEDINVQGCNKGVRIEPTDDAGEDDGYWTSTSWKDIHIADCPTYGVSAKAPLGVRTWTWENVIIERNGTSGTAQMHVENVNFTAHGLYMEGSDTVPAIKVDATGFKMFGSDHYFNGTGGIDCNSLPSFWAASRVTMTSATDVISNIPSSAEFHLTESSIQTDLRSVAALGALISVTMKSPDPDVTVENRQKYLSVGQAPSASYQPGEARLLFFGKKTYSGTITAGARAQAVTDHYFPGILANGVGVGTVLKYERDLRVTITPATSGSTDYFCVDIHNVSGSDITLTSADIMVMIWRANNPETL